MVKRYEYCWGDMSPRAGGDYVSYEDYAALEKLYQAAIEHMVAVHQRYNSDAGAALQKLYELSGKDE